MESDACEYPSTWKDGIGGRMNAEFIYIRFQARLGIVVTFLKKLNQNNWNKD